MANRTLGDLPLGTVVFAEFGNGYRDFIVTEKDSNSVVIVQRWLYESKRMNNANTTVYEGCEMDVWLEDEAAGYLSNFPAAIRASLVNRTIDTFTYGAEKTTISRKAYLLSYYEIFGTADGSLPTEGNRVYPAMWLVTIDDANGGSGRIAYLQSNHTAQYWWLRSPISASQYRNVGNSGAAHSNNATNSYYVRPALSVASATIVSPEGADTIYLTPSGDEVVHTIDAVDVVGETNARPAKAVVVCEAQGLDNIKVEVCNNYGDEDPVWEDATGGVEVTFANTEKTTEKWKIAVRMHGESSNFGAKFYEPYVKILED